MKNRMTAIVMATSLAVSGIATAPAHAESDGEKAILMLLGAAAIYGIAKTAEKDRKDRAENQVVTRQDYWYRDDRGGRQGHGDDEAGHHRRGHGDTHRWRDRATLPVQCMRETDGKGRPITFLERSCVARSGYRGRLPESCAALFPTRHGYVPGLGARCLSRQGYVLVDRRP